MTDYIIQVREEASDRLVVADVGIQGPPGAQGPQGEQGPPGSGTDWSGLVGKPDGLVSSSAQINYTNIQNQPTQIATASLAVSASYATTSNTTWLNVASKPAGLVSSSVQVTYGSVTGIPTGLVSASAQVPPLLPAGTVSSSAQVNYNNIQNQPTSIASATSASHALVANTVLGTVTSASYAVTASYAMNGGGMGSSDWNSLTNKPAGLVSSSAQVSFTGLTSVPAGLVSSSTQVTFTGLSGRPAGLVSSSVQINTGSFSGTFVGTASYAQIAGTASYISGALEFPNGLTVTGSTLSTAGFTGSLLGTASIATYALQALSASWAPSTEGAPTSWTSVTGKPDGLVSSSAQVDFTAVSNKPTLVSSSAQVSYPSLAGLPVGIVSSSTQFNGLTGTSASYATVAATASYVSASVVSASAVFVTKPIVYHTLYPIDMITGSAQYAIASGSATATPFELLLFASGTQQYAQFQIKAIGYVTTSAITVTLGLSAVSSSATNTVFGVSLSPYTPGSGQVLSTGTYGTVAGVTQSMSAQSRSLSEAVINVSDLVGLKRDDLLRINVTRPGTAVSDTSTGSVGLAYVQVQYGN